MAGRAFARRFFQAAESASMPRSAPFGFSRAAARNPAARIVRRRSLLSLRPLHSATADCWMVSRISGCTTCYEGIFLKWLTMCLENSQSVETQGGGIEPALESLE